MTRSRERVFQDTDDQRAPSLCGHPTAVEDLDRPARAIVAHGGRISMDRAPVPTVGILTKFEDPEGNGLGAMIYERKPNL